MSPKYTLNKADLVKIATAFVFSLSAAAVTFLIAIVEQIDFAEYAFVVPIINVVLYTLKKWIEGAK